MRPSPVRCQTRNQPQPEQRPLSPRPPQAITNAARSAPPDILHAVSAASSSPAPSKIVELTTVSRLYGTFAALRKVSISFEQGRCYVLLGENGAGKSTLLRTIAGLLRPTFGEVAVFGGEPHE